MNKAIFLDRDGTINVDFGYVYKPQELELLPGVAEALRIFQWTWENTSHFHSTVPLRTAALLHSTAKNPAQKGASPRWDSRKMPAASIRSTVPMIAQIRIKCKSAGILLQNGGARSTNVNK